MNKKTTHTESTSPARYEPTEAEITAKIESSRRQLGRGEAILILKAQHDHDRRALR